MPAGGTVTVTISGTLSPDFTGGLGNTAIVSSQDPDPDPADNTASVSVDTDAAADLSLSKELLGELVAGGQSTYRLTITNSGPAQARNVAVTDSLDPSLTFVSASVGECAPAADGAVVCGLGDLPAGGQITVDIVVNVAPAAAGTIPNTAGVAAATRDPDTDDNTVGLASTVVVKNDVGVTVTANQTEVAPGAEASFTVVVTNHGPQLASDVVLTNQLPTQLVVAAVLPGGPGTALHLRLLAEVPPECQVFGTTAICDLGDFAVAESRTLVFGGTVAAETPAAPRSVDRGRSPSTAPTPSRRTTPTPTRSSSSRSPNRRRRPRRTRRRRRPRP